ncbi:MAG TPA: hypothetical protein VG142_18370 [Trebonia sp.]|jgi:hypothetical protein|nr:hypothetical protein [Trebonia sp.]
MPRIRQAGALLRRYWLLIVAGVAVTGVAVSLVVPSSTFGLLSATRASGGNRLTAGAVTLTDSAIANCPVASLLPNATAVTCTFTATYAGSVPAYVAVNVLIETQAGGGGTRLYNPGDAAHDLQVTITSSTPTVTYTVPTTATTCPGSAPSGSLCYELDNELVSTASVSSAAVGFTVSLSLPSGSSAGYQGGAAQVILTTHAVQSASNVLSCTATPAAGSPCTSSGSFTWS